jgi:hypothetical protein
MTIQAGLFSAALTAFILDSKQNLRVSPTDRMVYYLQQNVAMLDQISRQISFIAPQFSISSTPPPPFPAFKPLASDIRVNVFWFMALVFSLSAALLAILVQQWVRDYMHVFQRYSDPLKSARLRQYLHEGSEGWYMPVVAEAVPGLLHVSLFLFLVGLCDFVLSINTTVGLSTTVPIAITGFLYIFTTFAPVIYPQSPYQNSFSGLIWYLIQKLGGRRFKDRGLDGTSRSVSLNMAEGQMQLAMEETEDRKGRDERAIRWLVSNMTEDAEMESFAMAVPGSFNSKWGLEVWKEVSNPIEDENRDSSPPTNTTSLLSAPPPPRSHCHSIAQIREDVIHELSTRLVHLFETRKNRGLFSSDELWRKRTRACVETTAALVCCAGVELGQFGDMTRLLGDIGSDQKMRESSLVGKDQSFVMRWTCLSLVTIRPILESDGELQFDARRALLRLEGKAGHDTSDEQRIPNVIEIFDQALKRLNELPSALIWGGNWTEKQVKEVLRNYESQIAALEHINIEDDSF